MTKPALKLPRIVWLLATLAAIAVVNLLTPVEQELGAKLRLVYLHGAWVWAGILAFGAAALAGLCGLFAPQRCARWSLALGRTGLVFWLTYLPMSLLVMQLMWGGFSVDEPRWRIPFYISIAGVILPAALAVMDSPRITCAANLVFGAAIYALLLAAGSVLHPESPIFSSGSTAIKVVFVALLALTSALGAQIAAWLMHLASPAGHTKA